jgi:hypothetical protein
MPSLLQPLEQWNHCAIEKSKLLARDNSTLQHAAIDEPAKEAEEIDKMASHHFEAGPEQFCFQLVSPIAPKVLISSIH